jgi:UDP-N-acetylmuramoyl-tripeptide--D-alanyl-D-alanine ligase
MKNILKKIVTAILIFESKIILKKYKPKIIAVTGTVGKTSTKDAIFTVLSKSIYVRKSEKSFNSEIGVPLTILGCENGWNDPFIWLKNIFVGIDNIIFNAHYPDCLVLEVGADHPGDIQSITKWLKTDISVITKIGDVPVHVEFFSSPEEVLKEKSYLVKALKTDGTLVLYTDDRKASTLSEGVTQKIISYGISNLSSVRATDVEVVYDNEKLPKGMFFKLNYQDQSIPVRIDGILGSQQIYPLLAGASVGIALDISLKNIVSSFENHEAPRGRMNILKGINSSIIIDDTYNSSPDALREGLHTLASLQVSGKRIAVLGDMLELGQFSHEEHRKAGVLALQSSDLLITVGNRAKGMSANALNFRTSKEAADHVKGIVSEGDVVFVKGSQSMRMERVSKALLQEPEKAPDLLVRQEEEWLAKK